MHPFRATPPPGRYPGRRMIRRGLPWKHHKPSRHQWLRCTSFEGKQEKEGSTFDPNHKLDPKQHDTENPNHQETTEQKKRQAARFSPPYPHPPFPPSPIPHARKQKKKELERAKLLPYYIVVLPSFHSLLTKQKRTSVNRKNSDCSCVKNGVCCPATQSILVLPLKKTRILHRPDERQTNRQTDR